MADARVAVTDATAWVRNLTSIVISSAISVHAGSASPGLDARGDVFCARTHQNSADLVDMKHDRFVNLDQFVHADAVIAHLDRPTDGTSQADGTGRASRGLETTRPATQAG